MKHEKTKKLLALILTVLMCLSLLPTAYAGSGSEDVQAVEVEDVLPVEGETYQFSFLSGANHQVDAVDGEDLQRLELGVATGYGNAGVRRCLVEPADEIAALLVGMFGYRAGVDHEAVDVRTGFDFFPAR